MLVVVVALAGAFAVVNGIHDAGNAIAAPIVTRAVRPAPAVVFAAVFHVLGALVVGTAVAATVAGIVLVPAAQILDVLAAAVLGALVWNLVTLWWGLPCSSGHCLVGALAGAAIAEGGLTAVRWGGLNGLRPVGVFGSLLWLLFSSAVALPLAAMGIRLARRSLRKARREVERPVRGGELVASAGLAFAHGSNDAQKTMGLMTAALVAQRQPHPLRRPLLGGARVRAPFDVRDVARRVAGGPHARSAHLSHPFAGRLGQPGLVGLHRPGRLAGRRPHQHLRCRGPRGRRRRHRGAVAPRTLGRGR